mmetsp:Transcript_47869/g.147621  ORF Transcript_47869/g.147621 Transcript_47869/m.147621 type:complete len:218 (-) Transcript_47869:75-728(-)
MQHHQTAGGRILELNPVLWAPRLRPRVVEERLEELVGEHCRGRRPRALEAALALVCLADGMPSANERDHLLWCETHDGHAPLEVVGSSILRVQVDRGIQVLGLHAGLRGGAIRPAEAHRHCLAAQVLERRGPRDDDQVPPRERRPELVLDRLQQRLCQLLRWLVGADHQAVVVGPILLRSVQDASPVAAPTEVRRAEGPCAVPRKSDKERAVMLEVC